MRYYFSAEEIRMIRDSVAYALASFPSLYDERPTSKQGLRSFKKLNAKLQGVKSTMTADQVPSAAGYERRAEAADGQIASAMPGPHDKREAEVADILRRNR